MQGIEKVIIDNMKGMTGLETIITVVGVTLVFGMLILFAVGGVLLALEKRKK